MPSPKFARVIPVRRTPFGVEVFDYRIPEGLTIHPGDLVRIPFRKQESVGLVEHVLDRSAFGAQARDLLGHYAELRFPHASLGLLADTAARTFSSKPAVLKAWLRSLPKRPQTIETNPRAEHYPVNITATWLASPEAKLLERAKLHLAEAKRVLIVVPWLARVRSYAATLEAPTLTSEENDGNAFRAWQGFVTGASRCLVTTRLGAWLAPFADVVLLDEPENDDHKQDELAPRYDARRLITWTAINGGTIVEAFGRTPPLHKEDRAPAIDANIQILFRHPQGRSAVPVIQADALLALEEHPGARVVIHPVRGASARLVCRDCGWRAECAECGFGLRPDKDRAKCSRCGKFSPMPEHCGNCGGYDLGKSMPGIDKLKQLWDQLHPELAIEWRDLSNEAMDALFPKGALVVLTDASLLGGAGEDIRRRERQAVAFRRLAARIADAGATLLLQTTEEKVLPWQDWLTPDGFQAYRERERAERKVFRYPPTIRLVKAIITGSEDKAQKWKEAADQMLKGKALEVRGPFPASFQLKSKETRWIVHLLFSPSVPEEALMPLFAPFAKHAILDLDPIAFLR
jgi:primosomal protein N'